MSQDFAQDRCTLQIPNPTFEASHTRCYLLLSKHAHFYAARACAIARLAPCQVLFGGRCLISVYAAVAATPGLALHLACAVGILQNAEREGCQHCRHKGLALSRTHVTRVVKTIRDAYGCKIAATCLLLCLGGRRIHSRLGERTGGEHRWPLASGAGAASSASAGCCAISSVIVTVLKSCPETHGGFGKLCNHARGSPIV